MCVDHPNLFRARKPCDFPKHPQIHTGLFMKSDNFAPARRDFPRPCAWFFEAADNKSKVVRGVIDQVNHNSFQPADTEAEHYLHDGLRHSTNFILRMANRDMRSRSQPCLKRLMLVAP